MRGGCNGITRAQVSSIVLFHEEKKESVGAESVLSESETARE